MALGRNLSAPARVRTSDLIQTDALRMNVTTTVQITMVSHFVSHNVVSDLLTTTGALLVLAVGLKHIYLNPPGYLGLRTVACNTW